ncbi:hypothetical protein F8154_05040 [Alkaliphilus pronyensis]|uniref:Flagellar assembly protein FliH/Type III secretion system HrpE domain-containing protein n=1 Tax=Alkaliphilus pronyensis TaxID=1482732 RepID=A0A6I0FAQ4_9FIRM|nr:FliH/SctL family protein [Alkaliphilus pronyensis]KAB3535884.1 hypothetical protein F8154_05040 [Alkaliphilus pronyensis]
MSKIRVLKSAEVKLGDKKEIDFNEIKLNNIIKLHSNEEAVNEEEIDTCNDEANKINEELEAMLNEAKEEAQRIIEEAKKEAAFILGEAYEDSKNIFENAKREGYSAGIAEGKDLGHQEVAEHIDEAKNIKLQALEEKNRAIKEAEKDVVKLVIECVNKIINYKLEEDNSLLLEVIRAGLEKSTFTESIVIRVSKADYDLVNTEKNKIFMMTDGIEKMDVRCDASLPSGGVMIETLSGTIDSSISTQIKAIEKILTDITISE